MQVITVATMSTLPRARALAASLRRHQPDWPLKVMLIGREDAIAAAARGRGVAAHRLGLTRARPRRRDAARPSRRGGSQRPAAGAPAPAPRRADLRAGSAPAEHGVAARRPAADRVDAARRTASCSCRAPRVDVPDDGLEPSREQLDRAGRIDDTIVAVDGGAAARKFLAWWIASRRTDARIARRVSGRRPPGGPPVAGALSRAGPGALLDRRARRRGLQSEPVEPASPHARGERGGGVGRRTRAAALPQPAGLRSRPPVPPGGERQPRARQPLARPARALRALRRRAAGGRLAGCRSSPGGGRRLADGLVYDDSLRATYAGRSRSERASRTCSATRGRARSSPGWKGRPRAGARTASTATSSTASRASARTCCAPIPIWTARTGRVRRLVLGVRARGAGDSRPLHAAAAGAPRPDSTGARRADRHEPRAQPDAARAVRHAPDTTT